MYSLFIFLLHIINICNTKKWLINPCYRRQLRHISVSSISTEPNLRIILCYADPSHRFWKKARNLIWSIVEQRRYVHNLSHGDLQLRDSQSDFFYPILQVLSQPVEYAFYALSNGTGCFNHLIPAGWYYPWQIDVIQNPGLMLRMITSQPLKYFPIFFLCLKKRKKK